MSGTVALGAGSAAIGSLTAGSAVIGHVVVDASSAVIGHVIVDSGVVTTVGTVTTVAAVTTVGNITGTVSLPTGAATSAKQPALGTAGTASADVLSVQGIAGGTPVPISGTVTATLSGSGLALESGGNLATVASAVYAEDAASANADKGVMVLAMRKDTAPTQSSGTNGDYEPLQVNGGRLWCSALIDTALPVGSNVIGQLSANQSVNVTQWNGATIATSTGVTGAGVLRVDLTSDGTGQVRLAAGSAAIGSLTAGSAVIGHVIVDSGSITVASHAVTNAGTFAVQAAATEADGANVTLGAKADAKSTATDTTSVTIMSVLKQISASVQAPPTQAVTVTSGTITIGAGSAAIGSLTAGTAVIGHVIVDSGAVTIAANSSVNVAQVNGVTTQMGAGTVGTGTQRVAEASCATGTLSNVAGSASSVTILAGNTARRGAAVFNDSSATLYLNLAGATASTTAFTVRLNPYAYYEVPGGYNGLITGIWSAASGSARVSEFS